MYGWPYKKSEHLRSDFLFTQNNNDISKIFFVLYYQGTQPNSVFSWVSFGGGGGIRPSETRGASVASDTLFRKPDTGAHGRAKLKERKKKRSAVLAPLFTYANSVRARRWRRRRDSNPRGLASKRFSRPPRCDRFARLLCLCATFVRKDEIRFRTLCKKKTQT